MPFPNAARRLMKSLLRDRHRAAGCRIKSGMTEYGETQTEDIRVGAKAEPLAQSQDLSHHRGMKGYVYILASKRNGTIYTGVTSDLPRRLYEHQNDLTPGFTTKYGVKTLVWFEEHDLVVDAIAREKAIKNWPRKWKLDLIEAMNPEWDDIAHYLHGL